MNATFWPFEQNAEHDGDEAKGDGRDARHPDLLVLRSRPRAARRA